MSKQRPQLPPLDFQGLTRRRPNLFSIGNASKERPVTPSTAAPTARSVGRESLSPQREAQSARDTCRSRQTSWRSERWRSESCRLSAVASEWSHRASSPGYRGGVAPMVGKSYSNLAVPMLELSSTAMPATPLSGMSSRSPPVPELALPVAMPTPSAGVSTSGLLAAKLGHASNAVPSNSRQTLEPSREPGLPLYFKDLDFDAASQARLLARKLPAAAPCAEVALPKCGYTLRAYAPGAVKPPTLESSFIEVQEDDDRKMLQRSGGNEKCRPLQRGDTERMQQLIIGGKEHYAYYVSLSGKPQPRYSSVPKVFAAPWFLEGNYIPSKIKPTAGSAIPTLDDDAKNGGPTFNDKMLGSQIASGDARHSGRIQGVMYEYAPGIGRVQTVYCANEGGVLYSFFILPKMTPFDILRWKARKEQRTKQAWWNPLRWCGCIELVDIDDK